MQNDTLVAVDLAKSVFEVAVSDRPGQVGRRERLPRAQFLSFFAQQPEATVVMEACGSAHFWARRIQALGHRAFCCRRTRPALRPPQQDRSHRHQGHARGQPQRGDPPRPGQDRRPAGPDLAASPPLRLDRRANRPHQHPARAAARVRDLDSRRRAPRRPHRLGSHRGRRSGRPRFASPGPRRGLPARSASSRRASARSSASSTAIAAQLPVVAHLLTIPGIGLLIATALVAFVGDIHRFPSARHFASYLGLTPREYSSGLKRRLGRISKRGDVYLRTLLIHGARSVLLHARKQPPDRLRAWAHELAETHVHNKAAVAVANKLARIVWAVWTRSAPYQPLAA